LRTVPAVPGSVQEYHHHIFVKLPPRPSDVQPWWPAAVEREPAVLAVFRALAQHRAQIGPGVKTKVTAFDEVQQSARGPREGTCELLVWPAGLRYTALPVADIDAVVAHALAATGTPQPLPLAARSRQVRTASLHCSRALPVKTAPPTLPAAAAVRCWVQAELGSSVMLFVCCHAARDARCGARGPPLAAELLRQVRARGLEGRVQVLQSSHVGGHRFAGNLLVYGPSHPADGDWFGGLTEEDAPQFLEALAEMDLGTDGGAGDARLRRWWRGRMGLAPGEQAELFAAGGGLVEEELATDDEDDESEGEGEDEE
jgi:hypothetical protein